MGKMSITLLSSGLLVLGALAFVSACGSDSKDTDTSTPVPTGTASSVTFAQANTVLKAKCAGSSCHSSGSTQIVLVDSEANLNTYKSKVKARIATGASAPMPPSGSPALTDAERTTLNSY